MIDNKDIAITLTSDQVMRFWSIDRISLIYKISANHSIKSLCQVIICLEEKEVLSCCSLSRDQEYLVTADSGGYFKVWDISSLSANCSPKENPIRELVYIKAHQKEISCIDFVEMDNKRLIVTGSRDKNLNLFTTEGIHVGVFGRILWRLRDPNSYWKKKPRYGTPVPKRVLPDCFDARYSLKNNIHPQGRRVTILDNSVDRSNSPPKSLQRFETTFMF